MPERRRSPFFSLLTLNTNKQAGLAGLPALLRDTRPDFVFLQEVNISAAQLAAAVGGLGYTAAVSTSLQPRRCIAVLSLHPDAVVEDLWPGFLQKVVFCNFAIFHLHAPSGNNFYRDRTAFFWSVEGFVEQAVPFLPLLVGDFNCVTAAQDLSTPNPARMCPFLRDSLLRHSLADAYRVLHPATA